MPGGDRIAATMLTLYMQDLDIAEEAGWIMRAEGLQLQCSYAGHGQALEPRRDCPPSNINMFCMPGCPVGITQWCSTSIHFSEPSEPCAWKGPENLNKMLEQQRLWDNEREKCATQSRPAPLAHPSLCLGLNIAVDSPMG
eukprot:3540050-Prymnesium_polylepis.2